MNNNIFKYKCPYCGNSDLRYIGNFNGKQYCRLCLTFDGRKVENNYKVNKDIKLFLNYKLSKKQEECSNKVKDAILNNYNVLIHAVTGAGKTELVYQTMECILKKGGHVGFATPRKDVVIDLYPRINESFKNCKVVAIYGEHTAKLEGDIIVLTTHQLYRYPKYFDLLILDEIDAFPFKDNKLLNTFFYKSIRGNYILLSATPSHDDLKKIKENNGVVVELFERYHKHDLPTPEFHKLSTIKQYFFIFKKLLSFKKENKKVFIFTPTIKEGKKLYFFLSLFFKDGSFVSSKEELRKIDIEKFKTGMLSFLVTTSILERGVTVKNLQVFVFNSGSEMYTKEGLIQIAGRAGRKIDAPEGKVYFLNDDKASKIDDAINEINQYNLIKNKKV